LLLHVIKVFFLLVFALHYVKAFILECCMSEQQGVIFLQLDATVILSNPDINMLDYLFFSMRT